MHRCKVLKGSAEVPDQPLPVKAPLGKSPPNPNQFASILGSNSIFSSPLLEFATSNLSIPLSPNQLFYIQLCHFHPPLSFIYPQRPPRNAQPSEYYILLSRRFRPQRPRYSGSHLLRNLEFRPHRRPGHRFSEFHGITPNCPHAASLIRGSRERPITNPSFGILPNW